MAKQAIEGTRLNAFAVDPNDLVIIGLDTDDGPEHPLYDPRVALPVDESLVKAMMADGFTSTIRVAKDGGERVLVVYGRQRVKAAREANRRLEERGREPVKVVCMVHRGTEADLFGVMVSENEIRRDNTPLQRAELVSRYLAFGRSEEEAAIRFGCSVATIQNYLTLLELAAPVRKAVEAGKLSASAAAKLVKLTKEEQVAALEGAIEAGGTTARDVQERVARARGETTKSRPGVRDIKAVLENEKLHPAAKHALLWVLGEKESASV